MMTIIRMCVCVCVCVCVCALAYIVHPVSLRAKENRTGCVPRGGITLRGSVNAALISYL
jgi:hypothetical protein